VLPVIAIGEAGFFVPCHLNRSSNWFLYGLAAAERLFPQLI